MTNSAITRAASVGISNAGLAPYGSLTSPDGVMLTWNGQAVNTGGGGSAAAWSTFPAISGNVDLSGSTITSGAANPIAITAATNLGLNATAGTVTTTASANIAENAGANYNVTVDQGANVVQAAGINLTAQNGLGGNIVLNSEGGFSVLGQQVGFGAIELNALGAANQAFALGGKIDLNAYSAGVGDYGGFTSRVSASAATIALSAGSAPVLPGLAGSMNIFGQGAVSIVASVIPPILPQIPETVYAYGLLGVRLESPAGIQMLSDMYAGNVYPISGGDLVLQGRTLPDGFVRIEDCTNIDMVGTGAITGVQTINGAAYPPPAGDASAWATFGASATIDASSNGITNVASMNVLNGFTLTSPGTVEIIAPTKVLVNSPLVDLSGGSIGNALSVLGATAQNLAITSVKNLNLTGLDQVNILGNDGTTITDPSGVTIIAPFLDMSANKIVNLAAGTVSGDAVNYGQLTFRDSTEFYVSSQGNDANNGSILSPKLTIQAAITAAELISSAALICNINVASGHYTENLTFNKGYVVLNGTLQSQLSNEICEITGSITINCTGADDVFQRQVALQGFNITCGAGQSITNTSTSSHTFSLQDVKLFVNSVAYISTATCADARTLFTNVDVNQSSAASVATVITTNVGQVEFERVDLNVDGNAIGLAIGGTSILTRLSLGTMENTNSAVILKPLINITSSTTSAHSIALTSFVFTSAVAKTNSSAVAIASSIATVINMLNCFFTLAGTSNSTNNCVSYNGVGSPTIAGVNNTSLSVNVLLPQTTSIQSGITSISYIDIQPPGLACYSSSVDQVIAVSGVPQALTFNTTQFNSGTTLLLSSRVYANAQGNYALNYSVELQHTGAGAVQTATIFLKKNGSTIAATGRQWSITSASFQIAAMAEFVVALNAGDYVEVFFSGDTSLSANATAATAALPAIPSVVFNIKQFR